MSKKQVREVQAIEQKKASALKQVIEQKSKCAKSKWLSKKQVRKKQVIEQKASAQKASDWAKKQVIEQKAI